MRCHHLRNRLRQLLDPTLPFVGKDGRDIREGWGEGVSSYLSIGIPNFPNHFTFCGPYDPLGHGSLMPLIERWTQ